MVASEVIASPTGERRDIDGFIWRSATWWSGVSGRRGVRLGADESGKW